MITVSEEWKFFFILSVLHLYDYDYDGYKKVWSKTIVSPNDFKIEWERNHDNIDH